MIVKAAIKRRHKIYTGKSHCEIITNNMKIIFDRDSVEGFITDTKRFFNRKDAAIHAYLCGQIKERKEILYSGDIKIK